MLADKILPVQAVMAAVSAKPADNSVSRGERRLSFFFLDIFNASVEQYKKLNSPCSIKCIEIECNITAAC